MLSRQPEGSKSLTVVSTGLANVGSVVNMYRRLGIEPIVSDNPEEIGVADRLVLPGVGAFDQGMGALVERGLDVAIKRAAESGIPLLGICLGMQMLFDASEEGSASGLGLISGTVRRLPDTSDHGPMKIPHMGWSVVDSMGDHPLLSNLPSDSRFYFVHSYAAVPSDENCVIGTSVHGVSFVSAVACQTVMGVQFHPEKSHRYGKALLANFAGGV